MSDWYYADAARQRQGPLSASELALRFHQGAIRLDTLVWRDGLPQWQPLRDFSEELALHQAPAETFYQVADAATRSTGPTHDSPYAPPAAELTSASVVHAGGEVVYAGFWKRVAAYVIDSFVVGIAAAILGAIIGGVMAAAFGFGGRLSGGGLVAIQLVSNLASLAISAIYYAWFHASANQATLGKMAVGIKVVRTNGEPISFARGIGRYFATILSSLILGIGFLMAAFTERKQALHDMICDTLVVDKWAFTDHPEWQRDELGTVTVVILVIFGLLMLGVLAILGLAIGLAAAS